ncbi:malate:quinone oxidoreductase, partial [Escherichia coli]|uniref:malate:quinone oxidoreductase n=1 Tax=Escherichia coli TaxID=562 RepID=UPI00334E86A8
VTLKMPAFEWVHVQLHQQKGMISLSPPTICNSALKQMFPQQFNSPEWQSRIHAIVPSYGQKLNGNVALTQQVWDDTAATLQLTKPPVIQMPAAAPTATAKPAETPREASPQHDMAL